MSDRKIGFFCKRSKVDEQTQTPAQKSTVKDKRSTVDKVREFEADHFISGDILPKTDLDNTRCRDFSNTCPFYYVTLKDERFDVLTPPRDLFKNVQTALIFTFYEDKFTICGSENNKVIGFTYERLFDPILESLETGIMSKEFVTFVVEKFRRMDRIENGHIYVQVVDRRVVPERSYVIPLKAGDDVMRYYISQERSALSALERESRYVAARNPVICTDPSPDVARIECMADFRAKMWTPHRTGREEPPPPKKREVHPPQTGTRFLQIRSTDVAILPSTQEKCAHWLRASTEVVQPPPTPQMHG